MSDYIPFTSHGKTWRGFRRDEIAPAIARMRQAVRQALKDHHSVMGRHDALNAIACNPLERRALEQVLMLALAEIWQGPEEEGA